MIGGSQKLSVIEKIGYSLGDLAANLIFQTLMNFLAFFYTDIYKIPAGTASIIILTGGFLGAFCNIIMGAIADRTNTRFGKFRPWVLWTAVPFGVIAILTFTTPSLGEKGKLIYAIVTYFSLVIIYSANNLPYSALGGVITSDMKQRNSLSSYRFVAVMIAQFIIQVFMQPLVLKFGHGDEAAGFKTVMTYFSIIAIIFFIITFFATRERIKPLPGQKSTLKQDLTDLAKNRPWSILLLVTVLIFITLALKGGMYIYYFKYYLNESSIAAFLEMIGFNKFTVWLNQSTGFQWPDDTATAGYSLFNACGILFMIVGIVFSRSLADKFGKRDVFGFSLLASASCLLMFVFYSPNSIANVFVTQIMHGFFYGITIPLLWTMIADVADYSEWKNNRRATAIIFSAMISGLKIGLSVGGALGAAFLEGSGYIAGLSEQKASAVSGIKLSVSLYPDSFSLLLY
jgi:Na+/melibiose symporter-like transporter